MPLDVITRHSPGGLFSESPAEEQMANILEEGPGTHARAIFARADGWHSALKAVASDPTAVARARLIVFPQIQVNKFRTDFMVVAATVSKVMKRTTLGRFGFFVEVDGLLGHAENPEQVAEDRIREAVIRKESGMSVLRFSGAETMFQKNEVYAVVNAQVEALAALREWGSAVEREADAVLDAVRWMSMHRATRRDYTARNSRRSSLEPYDPSDPFGEEGFPQALLQEATDDEFLDLRVQVARLKQAVSRALRDRPDIEEYEPNGELRPFQEAFVDAVETAFRAWQKRAENISTR